jgi:sugar lactone lactonase YvrE
MYGVKTLWWEGWKPARFWGVTGFFFILMGICSNLGFAFAQSVPIAYSGAIACSVSEPQRISVAGVDDIYITEPRAHRLARITPSHEVSRLPVAGIAAVETDLDGHIVAASRTRVDLLDDIGARLLSLGSGEFEFKKASDVAVQEDGSILVCDSWAHCVKVYNKHGRLKFSFGSKGGGDGQFFFPTGLAVSPLNGEICVSDQGNGRIQIFDEAGRFQRSFGSPPEQRDSVWIYEGRFSRAQGLTIDALGRIYVADAYQGSVQVFSAEGRHLHTICKSEAGECYFSTPLDVGIRGNTLYVISLASSSVQMFAIADLPPAGEDQPLIPSQCELYQNFPNPFNNATSIPFRLARSGEVSLSIWGIDGSELLELTSGHLQAGYHKINWDGRVSGGGRAAAGVYIFQITIAPDNGGRFSESKPVVLLK